MGGLFWPPTDGDLSEGLFSTFRLPSATNEKETRMYLLLLPSFCLKERCAA